MSRAEAPALGSAFARLWTASVASNLADGLGRTAIPLIATTLTTDPLLIAGVTSLAFVPWLVFGIFAGVIVDRVDRRFAMAVANAVRVLAAVALALTISTDSLTIWLLYACVFVWGLGETVYDSATTAMVPSLVPAGTLERANSRIQAAELVVQNFIATPIAGVLFTLAIVIPVWSTAAGFVVSIALVLSLPVATARAVQAVRLPNAPTGTRADIKEGISFLVHHRFLRGMLITTSIVGGAVTLAQATLVLFVLETLDVPEFAFGFVAAGVGVGAVAGALTATSFVARFGRGRVLLGASTLCGLSTLAVGFSPNVWVAVPIYAIGAGSISVWNVPWGSLRQELTPGYLLGRITGISRTVIWGLFPIAGVLGGLIGRIDLRAPFWVGGGIVVIASLCASRLLLSASHEKPAHASPEGATESVGGQS